MSQIPENELELNENSTIQLDENGRYHWIYELPMLKSFFLLFEVWKVLGFAALIVVIISFLIDLFNGGGIGGMVFAIKMGLLCLGIMLVLSIPSYYIVTKANNGMYTVLFEMDETGIDHVQIKTDKAKALDMLVTLFGAAANNRTTTAAGVLSASGGSLYTHFSTVRVISAYRDKNLITLQGKIMCNQVYMDDQDFDFVFNYIVNHCPNAKVRY